jgi:hypothetical protein
MARINGRAIEGNDWAVLVSDPAGFTPMALPRLVVIHPVNGIDDLHQHLLPWRNHFSSLATDDTENKTSAVFQEICGWFPRISKPGRLQMPPFPRKHDGRPMLGSLLQPEAQKL